VEQGQRRSLNKCLQANPWFSASGDIQISHIGRAIQCLQQMDVNDIFKKKLVLFRNISRQSSTKAKSKLPNLLQLATRPV
jgi:hypothetical protein